MDLNRFFELGFSRNEANCYLSLMEQGKAPAQVLAKRLKLPRSTVYSVLDSLEKQNLVRREAIKSSTFFRAREPTRLKELLSEREAKLVQEKVIVSQLVRDLQNIYRESALQSPKIEFYEGKAKVERFLYDNVERWIQSARSRDNASWGFQDHTFVTTFPKWISFAFEEFHLKGGVLGRLLSNRSDVEKKLKGKIAKRNVRFLNTKIDFESSFWAQGDYVVCIMTRSDPVYCFQIHDPLLAANLRVLFAYLYEQAAAEA